MDAVLELVSEEDVVRYSAMTGQSLFYMSDNSLRHKILAVSEEEGAKQASYALKLLQSEGRVTMASTGKNPTTGMLTTHSYRVEGPVMLFLTTTATDLDEELLNRCLVLTVNESREQTRAIHARQRSRETLEGLLAGSQRQSILTLHRNAQRLLQPLAVVNPFADKLSFQDHQTRSRRDHVKYLTLIRSIALLHQFQRDKKILQHHGEPVTYIEVTPADIILANRLAHEVLGRTVDELLPQTRKLLLQVHAWVGDACAAQGISQADFRFTRRQIREALGWGDTQLKLHLTRLGELEFVVTHRGKQGRTYLYELVFQGELGLIDPTELESMGTTGTSRGKGAQFAGHGRAMVGAWSADGRGGEITSNATADLGFQPTGTTNGATGASGVSEISTTTSYPSSASEEVS
jgi:hypothetical protein